ncbi:MAG: ATP-binding protein [Alphaproteobacteria bacterium]|jgi:Na+/proline symporter/nitrogen-specific signal transduction histidine kinase
MSRWAIAAVAVGYLCLLFAVARWGDRRADAGRSVIASPAIYALSMAVYCTAWTFYGSVGRAAAGGIDFVAIYLGPTLAGVLWWHVTRKMLRISKANRITSIADFVAARYGKSPLLGGLVAVVALVVITPYIALQLKAVSASVDALAPAGSGRDGWILGDTAFYVAALMAAFAILYGTRHIDATERHEGMVAAIAFESIVKLVAFLAVGLYVAFAMFDGPGEIFARAAADPAIAPLLGSAGAGGPAGWVTLVLLSMAAILFLPRQFQVAIVENVDERHLAHASWMFPLYLLLINLFVFPIALAGLLALPAGSVDGDLFVLALPLSAGATHVALVAFVGGLAAATGMVIVETIALATMLCNDLVMPILLRSRRLGLAARADLTGLLAGIRRGSIVLVLTLGYLYFELIGGSYALVSIGLLSFAAVAQFAPTILGGMYWRGATRHGALGGLVGGFAVWAYTLLLPAFARSGWIDAAFISEGPLGIAALRPYALFGAPLGDPLTHALFWTMVANVGLFVGLSLATRPGATERVQATRFVEAFSHEEAERAHGWGVKARVADLVALVGRFVGPERARQAFDGHARARGLDPARLERADAGIVRFAERLLAGAIGAASARVMLATAVKGEDVGLDEVMAVLDEATAVIEYSRQLEQKSSALEAASAELRAANLRLQELDRLKDEFLTTVTHELRTPLTSIRSFSEILRDNPGLQEGERGAFLDIVIAESERLTRLINQVLDLAKIEAGRYEWQIAPTDPGEAVSAAIAGTSGIFAERGVALEAHVEPGLRPVLADRDQLVQVAVNLLSNAVKFSPAGTGRVTVALRGEPGGIRLVVQDNGPGIAPGHLPLLFDKFSQFGDQRSGKPAGSGLGLAICRRIVEHLGGAIAAESPPGEGARFSVVLPYAGEVTRTRP